jgi:hypothetical protein
MQVHVCMYVTVHTCCVPKVYRLKLIVYDSTAFNYYQLFMPG